MTCGWHPRGLQPGSQGRVVTGPQESLAPTPPQLEGRCAWPSRYHQGKLQAARGSPREAGGGASLVLRGCGSPRPQGWGWGGDTVTCPAGPPSGERWVLRLAASGDPGSPRYPPMRWGAPGWSWDWRPDGGCPHLMWPWPSPEARLSSGWRSACPRPAQGRGTCSLPAPAGWKTLLSFQPSGSAWQAVRCTPPFSSPSTPPPNCMKCRLCTRMGVVGTEYVDWNDSRTKIKLGQEGGGCRGAPLAPNHLCLRKSGPRASVRVAVSTPSPAAWTPKGQEAPPWGGHPKDQCHQAVREALRRGPEPA